MTSEEMDAVASVSRLLRKKGAFTAAPISPASPGARTWRERRACPTGRLLDCVCALVLRAAA